MKFFDEENSSAPMPEGRVEAIAKVTGKGKYSAEYSVENLCHGVLVTSEIPAGKITGFDFTDAKAADGVIDIITHENRPEVPGLSTEAKIKESKFGLPVFHTDKVYFKGQPVALVVAGTLEEAVYAASLVKVKYEKNTADLDFETLRKKTALKPEGKERGSSSSWENLPFTVDQEYKIAPEVHNPMEMHATIAHWPSENKLKLFDKNQGVNMVQKTLSGLYNIPKENIEVISEYVGGGFGSGLRVWPHTLAAAIAAKKLNRPVKLVLTRPQMFFSTGYRPESWQRVKLSASADGKIMGILHQAMNSGAKYDPFSDGITRVTRLIYEFPNLKTENAVVPLHLSAPTYMRGPGDCSGDFAIESALDELSYQLKMDPLELRYKNLSLVNHPDSKLPWSTNYLKEAAQRGAEMIKWNNRKQTPGSISEGEWKIGYGMSLGMWNAGRSKASAGIIMSKDGSVILQTAMTDIGTGTGTGMRNILHEATGIPKDKIKIELGNSNLPQAGSQGGSTGMSSVSGAVVAVADALREKLLAYAATANPEFKNVSKENIILNDKGISVKNQNASISYKDIFEKNNLTTFEVEASSAPGDERSKYAFCSSAAHFCRVKVHSKTGKVKIDKMVVVVDGGTIISEKPAANQISGAAIGGIGMALMEKKMIDENLGVIGNDLASYHFAVNADAPIVEVAFINKPDPNINPSGAKGLGEVGIIGTAAAIANAIYNATGKRFRDLPITPDKIIM
ncbi:aldehyde oxidase [Chryseobacterium sp. Leaf180]|uniref:xanthine dehydrogenase family protein molybdopterin-binding subunit n=1 Tax=Chryseobacterium sp. Leaf180 TaxID=1736289 RepID=UPI0006FCB863|nr:xanthine dehydrogenase family protein molybdopterin-binding subunit [Chryseobacterium sp. Leaf180]KQR94870.1 aldehyde oxidase [Chryseobacterium sp. Leaf180]